MINYKLLFIQLLNLPILQTSTFDHEEEACYAIIRLNGLTCEVQS